MGRSVFWQAIDTIGFEHLDLTLDLGSNTANGLVIQQLESRVLRMEYHIVADGSWFTRHVQVKLLGSDTELDLRADGEGRWRDANNGELRELEGCRDVDLQGTPFTNTLAIRRLDLQVGGAAEIKLVYIELPTLRLTTSRQRYTRLLGTRYLFEELESGFTAELDVDEEGVVVNYQGLWKRATNP